MQGLCRDVFSGENGDVQFVPLLATGCPRASTCTYFSEMENQDLCACVFVSVLEMEEECSW